MLLWIYVGVLLSLTGHTGQQQQQPKETRTANEYRLLIRFRKMLIPYGFRLNEFANAFMHVVKRDDRDVMKVLRDPSLSNNYNLLALSKIINDKFHAYAKKNPGKYIGAMKLPFKVPLEAQSSSDVNYKFILLTNGTINKFASPYGETRGPDCTDLMLVCNNQIVDTSFKNMTYDRFRRELKVKSKPPNTDMLLYLYAKVNNTKLQYFFYVNQFELSPDPKDEIKKKNSAYQVSKPTVLSQFALSILSLWLAFGL